MSKKVKKKSADQLHDEIMDLFIGQKMSTTFDALIMTTVANAKFLEIKDADFMLLMLGEMAKYEEQE